ncbi:ATP-binding protein [Salinarimonas soli]|uniref:histidine kinase n=1 Tax=Salinarimonas soli TaxID=1638099 RepID=A0A5B2VT68_9HYPH|nr:ATP-binding protein [Salinarimonas soli]KAA2242205.1 PAS domain S-box protein [Salinarimonas soli]
MVRWREDIGAAVEGWAGDPSFAPLLRAGCAVLVWDGTGSRPIWASGPAQGLADALARDPDGALAAAVPAASRLRALAGGLAPRAGSRLEKLRFDRSPLVPFATCACRLAALPSGEEVLITAFVGALPALSARARPAIPAPAVEVLAAPEPAVPDQPATEAAAFLGQDEPPAETSDALPVEPIPDLDLEEPEPEPPASDRQPEAPPAVDPLDSVRARGTVRFLWQADAAGRFVAVSGALAEIVGPEAADIVGRTWAEIGRFVEDPGGIVAEHFARGETWSGRTVLWRIGTGDHAVPVDLAGLTIRDRERGLLGFRGFGLIRAGAVMARPPSAAPDRAPAAEPMLARPAEGRAQPLAAPEEPVAARAPVHEASEPVTDAAVELVHTPATVLDMPAPEPANDRDEPVATFSSMAGRISADFLMVWETDVPLGGPVAEEFPVAADPQPEPATEPEAAAPAMPAAERPVLAEEPPAPMPAATSAEPEPAPEPVTAEALPAPVPAAASAEPEVAPEPPAGPPAPQKPASGGTTTLRLSAAERNAFREIARALGARFEDEEESPEAPSTEEEPSPPQPPGLPPLEPSATQVLARMPVGVLVHRGEDFIYANRALLDLAGYEGAADLVADGGLARLFRGRAGVLARADVETPAPVPLTTRSGETFAAEIRHAPVDWEDGPAGLMLVRKLPDSDPGFRLKALEADLRARDGRVRELASILDTATDGVVVLDDVGRILSLNRSAEALFGFEQNEVSGESFTALLAPESHVVGLDYLEGLRANGVASLLNDGREVLGRVRQGGVIPLFMTMGRVNDGLDRKFCAVLRDITAFKKAEDELLAAKRAAEDANAQKSDFLAKISHEIRTPLNAIIGFTEVMLEERFGPVGNERYRDYLRDIHSSGTHVTAVVNTLLDLAKVEAGRMELSFTSVSLGELVTACVSLMQPEAARARIVLRTSFAGKLPPVVADERSVRQVIMNLLSNAVKFTDAGGQVIVSTALTDRGEVAFRVRDTGIGMTEGEIEAALEPFRQLSTARRGGGTGLGLPLTKALVEANRGTLQISSTKSEGTLVEVVFPPTRVLAE